MVRKEILRGAVIRPHMPQRGPDMFGRACPVWDLLPHSSPQRVFQIKRIKLIA
jgi:hypothetical protein